MDDKRLYRYNKEYIVFEPLSKLKSFLSDNLFECFFLLTMLFICFGLCAELKCDKEIAALKAEINEKNQIIQMEKEEETLYIKAAQALFEGYLTMPPNDSVALAFIKECGAWYPEIVMAQYKIESASGTSDIAKKANNLFGMKSVNGARKVYTTQTRGVSYNGYGVYINWKLSIIDKILWEHFIFKHVKPDRKAYLNAHAGYAEAEEYTKAINEVAKKYIQ